VVFGWGGGGFVGGGGFLGMSLSGVLPSLALLLDPTLFCKLSSRSGKGPGPEAGRPVS